MTASPNHLIDSNSPYLLQHAHNPVDWYPWGEEALSRAQAEDKPIFLSIGYAACHWCHVMAHESFEDPATAELMNRHFINIKVDREERPDLDSIYMNAVVALTGQGGWPMSVFLTPTGEPFMGGTYFPPTARYGMPSFRELLTAIAQLWQEDRPRVLQAGQGLLAHLTAAAGSQTAASPAAPLDPAILETAARNLAASYDRDFGGWGTAPKFPQPMAIEFLLRRASRGEKRSLQPAIHALLAMSAGGMYDVVGGGFARYSTDNHWRVPHFEKMLYDNAQLALAYLHAFLITRDPSLRRICEATLDFIARELMAHHENGARLHGGFFSSLDADSDGEEGRFYLWRVPELRAALPNPDDFALLLAAYGLDPDSPSAEVLQRARDDASLAADFALDEAEIPARLDRLHARLLAARDTRVRPATDDKVLTAWNGLALRAFAEAARYLDRPDYLEIARHNADFLLTELNPNDDLRRAWRAGQVGGPAFLEDYAALTLGLFALYQTDADPYWYASACRLLESLQARFADPSGGWFDTQAAHTGLITRPKDLQDNATPSGNALAALAALQLAAFSGEDVWRARAEAALRPIQPLAAAHPTAFSQWLTALDLAAHPIRQVALLGPDDDPRTQTLTAVVWSTYRPDVILARAAYPPPPNSPPLLEARPLLAAAPTAYVCTGFVCRQPTTSPEELAAQLA